MDLRKIDGYREINFFLTASKKKRSRCTKLGLQGFAGCATLMQPGEGDLIPPLTFTGVNKCKKPVSVKQCPAADPAVAEGFVPFCQGR